MHDSKKDIKRNLFLFFIDGMTFMPSTALISISAVIPYFLTQLGASTFQIALAASLALVCSFISQPFFGFLATHSRVMNKTFGKILLTQRLTFLCFVLCIPVLTKTGLLVWIFLFFWGLFNIFVGSYAVFFTPLLIKLLPPKKRGTIRGTGLAVGSFLGLGLAALIPVLLGRISFPYNYTLIFLLGSLFLIVNAFIFLSMRQHKDVVPNTPMSIVQYLKGMPSSIRENAHFRAMLFSTMFIVAANSLLPYYTLYAIRIFSAAESHIAALTALAVLSNAFGHAVFGILADRLGPKLTMKFAALMILLAGILSLVTNSMNSLFVVWVFANLGNTCFLMAAALFLGEVSPSEKLPLYVGVHAIISQAFSSVVLLLLAPALERFGFGVFFAVVLTCGALSLLISICSERKANTPQVS